MSLFIKRYNCVTRYNAQILWRFNSTQAWINNEDNEEEFRVLDIKKIRQRPEKKVRQYTEVIPDRTEKMPYDQDWGNVWPGPRSFHPSTVPLPIRQGYVPKGQAPPGKKANAELMKIPNFLHLTPPVIKKQCDAIKKYCTEWPKLLDNEETIEKHYPQEIITSDYCHASPTIRNPLARIVTLRIKLSSLKLDKHARDKFLRLIGDRYNEETDLVTITSDRCPVRKQNLDYVNYLLTACYHESWVNEEWEKDKSIDDMEYYDWDEQPSKKSFVDWYLKANGEERTLTDEEYKEFDISSIPNAADYKIAVNSLFNDAESDVTLKNYAAATRKLFGLPAEEVV